MSLREHACVSSRGAQSTELVSLYIGYWTLNNYYYYYYVDLQYDEISLTFTAGPVCLCVVSSPVVVLGLFVRLS